MQFARNGSLANQRQRRNPPADRFLLLPLPLSSVAYGQGPLAGAVLLLTFAGFKIRCRVDTEVAVRLMVLQVFCN